MSNRCWGTIAEVTMAGMPGMDDYRCYPRQNTANVNQSVS